MLRSLVGFETKFANPIVSNFMQLAIKFDNTKSVRKSLDNFQKIFVGLRTSVVNNNFIKNRKENEPIKLPLWIQDCKTACEWILKNHTPDITHSLANIAFNDNIVVVNSCHAVSDGGFFINSLKHCLDDIDTKVDITIPPIEVLKDVFSEAYKMKPELYPFDKCSYTPLELKHPHLHPKGSPATTIEDQFPVEKLMCYDPKTKRPKSLTESLHVSLSLALNAMKNDIHMPLAMPLVYDMRRFNPNPNVNWQHGNFVSVLNIATNVKENMTINEIFGLIRDEMNRSGKHHVAYAVDNNSYTPLPETIFGTVSNAGPIRIHKPIVDFHIQARYVPSDEFQDDGANGAEIALFSLSKVFDDRNILFTSFNYRPTAIPDKKAHIIKDSIMYFLKEIPLDTKYKEAFDSIKNLQNKLDKQY
ncbi:hypothetical protein GPJ56_010416 [Histomonas meleagridis]|uniref:uncharacterized protein n=1 Tax=Histomonas meleagridis TaxID=135588 RepID=UPI00355A7800|nr:hypothetical protein GPJ56_010416 [Histomonas meleagridis]KAH0799025.1 hypothetical protein GO595_008177 [Histomonas meleagridis]